MADNLVGIYHLLAITPIWIIAAILWFVVHCVMRIMRDGLEGLDYQVSWSAKIGDGGLIVAVLIAATILQRGDAYLPEWLQLLKDFLAQVAVFVFCFCAGLLVSLETLEERSGQLADIYHDLVIAPSILFFAITLLPIVWYNARWYEGLAVVIAILVWAALVVVDFKTGRMNQRQWLVKRGFAIKGEILKR